MKEIIAFFALLPLEIDLDRIESFWFVLFFPSSISNNLQVSFMFLLSVTSQFVFPSPQPNGLMRHDDTQGIPPYQRASPTLFWCTIGNLSRAEIRGQAKRTSGTQQAYPYSSSFPPDGKRDTVQKVNLQKRTSLLEGMMRNLVEKDFAFQ